ncbi:MAG TPA: hypothetical protein VJ989_07995 [Solirubrobacterales bacterium]|nr:hypothetical protein [Solirubrobacterales bacterium]
MSLQIAEAALAKFQRDDVPGDVIAVFDRETGDPGLDGRKWRLMVTDGKRLLSVEAELTGSQGGSPGRIFDPAIVEAAVERRISSGYYRRDLLIDELGINGPISLRAEDMRPHPVRDHSIFF